MQRGWKTYTTLRAALICCLLCVALLALASVGGAFPGLGAGTVVLFVGPMWLLISTLTAGLVPALICLVMMLISLAVSGGMLVCAFGAGYLLPMMAAWLWCLTEKKRFWTSCGAVMAALVVSLAAIYMILQGMTKGMLYDAAGGAAAAAVNVLPARDSLLYMLASNGLLGLPSSMQDTALVAVPGGYILSAEAVSELLLQIRSMVSSLLQGLIPSMLISGSAQNAVAGIALSIYFGRRAAQRRAYKYNEEEQETPDLSMPPLRTWHIPRPWGLRIGLLASGYLLIRSGSNGMLVMLGTMMWQTFCFCYIVQGLATLNHSQHRRGTAKGWRVAVIVLAFVFRFMQVALAVVGVVDQISDSRGLRKPLLPHNEEE